MMLLAKHVRCTMMEMANVSITDEAGQKLEGGELLDCLMGKKKITEVLRAG
jgi:hypothetical protein